MSKTYSIIFLFLVCGAAAFHTPLSKKVRTSEIQACKAGESRANFLSKLGVASLNFAVIVPSFVQSAQARGRATLDQAYERYTPRIIAGGEFFSRDFRKLIEKNDWTGIKAATSDPPKKSKQDRSKIDGGVADRAALAGKFSDARVLVAADLFASTFSDNSISQKTKKMQDQVALMREALEGIKKGADEALGEGGGGGLLGFGGKKRSESEIAKDVRMFYGKIGSAYNQYIFDANDELPITLSKLPFLK